jgi:hypothetical protein
VPKGATGVGIRLLVDALEAMPKSKSKSKSGSKTSGKAKV